MKGYRKSIGKAKSSGKTTVRRKKNPEASERFRKITKKAQQIRAKHPKMKWKNCIKQASKELYG